MYTVALTTFTRRSSTTKSDVPLPLRLRWMQRLRRKKEAANLVGEIVARRALDKGVKEVVFDRGGYLYTGRVAEVAEGARKAGLEF